MNPNEDIMKLLSRTEELLLNCILRLQEDAYTFMISEKLKEITGKRWAFGAIFISLDRLERKGYINSYLGDETPERGGRRKRFYSISKEGLKTLIEIRKIDQSMWEDLPVSIFDQD
jgi:PadR family transcriptional regulator PadR